VAVLKDAANASGQGDRSLRSRSEAGGAEEGRAHKVESHRWRRTTTMFRRRLVRQRDREQATSGRRPRQSRTAKLDSKKADQIKAGRKAARPGQAVVNREPKQRGAGERRRRQS